MKTAPRFIAVFPEANSVPQYIVSFRVVVTMMTNNASFPNPVPPLPEITGHLDTLEEDEELARQGGMGAVEQRNASLAIVRNDGRLLKAFVQSKSDAAPADKAKSVIESAGFKVGKKTPRTKPAVSAKHGKIPRQVVLETKALPRPVGYRWQMSTTQETWDDIPESFKTATTVDGLTPATVYYFRLRTVTNDGLSEWSPIVSIIVL